MGVAGGGYFSGHTCSNAAMRHSARSARHPSRSSSLSAVTAQKGCWRRVRVSSKTVSVDIARRTLDWSPAGVGQGDCVYDPAHAGRFVGGRFGGVALQVRSDLTSQVHDTIQSLHVELIWRPQCRMLVQQCPYLGRDPRVAGASAGSAPSVCAVCGTSGNSARNDDDEGQNVEWFTPCHLIRVRAHLRTRLL
jgi:hypothetical protein